MINEKLVIELVAVIAGLIWLLKLTLEQSQFKKNHIHKMGERLKEVETTLKTELPNIKEDIRRLFERLDDHINGKK